MSTNDSQQNLQGDFQAGDYVRLLYSLCTDKKTGLLRLTGPRKNYQLHVVAGHIIGVASGSKQTLSRSLVDMGVVNETELIRAKAWAGEGGSIENALIELGILTHEEMDDCAGKLLISQIGKPLQWKGGHWNFTEQAAFDLDGIDPKLLEPALSMAAIWSMVSRDLSLGAVEKEIRISGDLLVGPEFGGLLTELSMPSSFKRLPEILAETPTAQFAISKLGGDEEAKRGVWLLMTLNCLRHTEAPPSQSPFSRASSSLENDESLVQVSRPNDDSENREIKLIRVVRSDYRRRMGQNYYAFLGLETDASRAEIDREARRLNKRWRAIRNSVSLDESVSSKIDELIDGVTIVHKTLGGQKSKKAYDRHLSKGRAPVVGVASDNMDSFLGIKELMSRGEFERAIPKLQQMRLDGSLNADVMSALGWCKWKIGLNKEAEDEIALALSLEPRHVQALEYSARIAIFQKKNKRAKKRIMLLLQQEPEHTWANSVLADLPKDESDMISAEVQWHSDEDGR